MNFLGLSIILSPAVVCSRLASRIFVHCGMVDATAREQTIAGSDNVSIAVALTKTDLFFRYRLQAIFDHGQNIFVALGKRREAGAAVLPFARITDGSTVFLPFKSDLLLTAEIRGDQIRAFIRRWERWRWSEREETEAFEVIAGDGALVFRVPRPLLGDTRTIDFVLYAKDPQANAGWGWFWACSDRTVDSGVGDKYIPHYHELRLEMEAPLLTWRGRCGSGESRIRIYQLFVRLFGNTNETRKRDGTLAENGVGRFADINDAALSSIKQMGFTHRCLAAGYGH
jgi:hypothetical protein